MWSTPNKGQIKCTNAMLSSPTVYRTPIKQNHIRCKQNRNCFNLLPSHITPPSGITKFIARNPFEPDLTNRLHLSMISPTVFSKVSSSANDSPGFSWSVDEIALIQPAKIEEFPIQHTYTTDPELEIKAQAAIDRFFDENQVIPSPCELTRKDKVKPIIITPTRPLEELNSSKELSRSKRDSWSQTVLSLPVDLPPVVEEALKPFFTFTQEQNTENDDANSSNNSLRRKLFFNHDDCVDNDQESSLLVSPVKLSGERAILCSPPQRGAFLHGTPLKRSSGVILCNDGTPMRNTENLSPNVSPISSMHNMSYEYLRSRSRSVMRLDFTMDMSTTECSMPANNKLTEDSMSQDAADNAAVVKLRNEANEDAANDGKNVMITGCTEVDVIAKNSSLSLSIGKMGPKESNHKKSDEIKILSNLCKVCTGNTYTSQNVDTQLGVSIHHSAFNSVQDTGYHTSTNCTMNILGSCNDSSSEQRICHSDHVAMPENDVRLYDWKENIKNIFSSTLSKSNKESHG